MDEGNKGYSKASQAILETDEQKREAVIRDYDDSAAQDNVAPLDNLVRKKEELLRLKEEQDRRKKLSEDIHGGHKKSEQPPAGWHVLSEERNAFGLRKRQFKTWSLLPKFA